ncbi:MAG: hypothetical protein ACI9ZT_001806 [Gammaproteobacteria bacterium]|jgi:hypothetical protein
MPEMSPDTILKLPFEVNIVAAIFIFAGISLLLLSFYRLRHRYLVSASIYGILSSGLVLTAIALIACSLNLYTYSRIIHEQKVAQIVFTQLNPQNYTATLTYADNNRSEEYNLKGDEWQLDARIIKWKSPIYLVGLDPLYRLERISGRYRDTEEEMTGIRTVYSLTENQGLDIWSITKKYPSWIPWVDAYYGSATYLPMSDKARFKITLSQTGLLARPVNDSGKESIQFWD